MKRVLFPILAAGASLLAMSAHANNGQIDFQGELTAQTCAVNVDGAAGQPAVVVLPSISANLLTAPNSVAASRGFLINLTGCAEQGGNALAFFEYNAAFVDPADGTLKNLLPTGAATASNVHLQILDGVSGDPIVVGSGAQLTGNSAQIIDPAGNATLPYSVQYISPQGNATAGAINSSVTYSIAYN